MENKGPDIDKEEEMTLLELKLNREIENESLNCKKIIEEISDDTILRVSTKLKDNDFTYGDLLSEGKLTALTSEIRELLSNMDKNQAKSLDLLYELLEQANSNKDKNPVGRPKNKTTRVDKKTQMKIDTFMDIEKK